MANNGGPTQAPQRQVDLSEMRQHWRAAVVDSDEHAQRLLSLGFGATAALMLVTAPVLGPALQAVWVGACLGLTLSGLAFRRGFYRRLRGILLEHLLQSHTKLDVELWEHIGRMKELSAPLKDYVEHVLEAYSEFNARVDEGAEVELGQVQLIEARDQVFEFIERAQRTAEIRDVIENHGHRLTDDDLYRLRQLFSEQCTSLHRIAQSFDRLVGSFLVAKVLGNEFGEGSLDDLADRMRMIEEEFDEVKQQLSVDA